MAVLCSLPQLHLAKEYADRIVGLDAGHVVVDCLVEAFDDLAATRLYGRSHDDEPAGADIGATL